MQSIELTAKTAEEAKTIAAEKLGVAPDQIEVTVIETVRGLFGKSSLRVKATVAAAPAPVAPPVAKPSRAKKAAAPVEEVAVVEAPVVEATPAPEAKPEKPARASRAKKAEPKAEPVAAEAAAEAPATEEAETAATPEDAEALKTHLLGWFAAGDLEVTAKVKEIKGRYVSLEIDGKDLGHLVGKHGEVLNAMQYLLNISAGRRLGNGVRCTLDGDDYRTRREEKLTVLATKIAMQVKERGEEAVLDALPAFECRVVHKALSTVEGVTTYSEGEEPNRRVVIAPAD